jgi:membrane protein
MARTVSQISDRAQRGAIEVGFIASLAFLAFAAGRSVSASTSTARPTDRKVMDKADDNASFEAVTEPGRGRQAQTPSQFGERAWKDILVRTYREFLEDRITTVGAGIAFYGLLALFPGIAALVSLYALIADPVTIRDHLFQLSFLLPPNAFAIVEDKIKRVVSQGGTELGAKFALGLSFSIWSANAGMKALIGGLNVAYEETEKRSFVRLNLISLGLTAATLMALLIIIGLSAVLPQIFDAEVNSTAATVSLNILRWPVLLALLALGLSVLYRFGPSRNEPQWRWVSWGGLVAAFLVAVTSLALSWYLTDLADYNKTYGSLGAVIGLITWMLLSACAVLIGAELNAEMEHQTARDTTIGEPKPPGTRGAEMADTIGVSVGH